MKFITHKQFKLKFLYVSLSAKTHQQNWQLT